MGKCNKIRITIFLYVNMSSNLKDEYKNINMFYHLTLCQRKVCCYVLNSTYYTTYNGIGKN